MISYDELTGRIIDLRQTRDQTNFEAGDLCWYAIEKLAIKPGLLAADTGYSAQHIRDLARTSKTFHSAEDRRPREYVEWSHYKIAARTDRPEYWIGYAEEQALSTRDLQRAVKESKNEEPDPLAEAKRALARVERVIDAGGEGAAWLTEQLGRFRSPQSTGENGVKVSMGLPWHTANTAGLPGSE